LRVLASFPLKQSIFNLCCVYRLYVQIGATCSRRVAL
jgi:hypothetical protein